MKIVGAIVIFSFFTIQSYARNISWTEAIELAKKNSADLQSAVATYDAAVEAEKSSISGFVPHLSARLSGTETGGEKIKSQFAYSAGLTLTQNLFSGLSDYSNYRLKRTTLEQAAVELENVRARISQELKQVYAETFYSQRNIKLSQDILERREENLRSVQLQFDAGQENKGSVLLSQANVDSAKLDYVHSVNSGDVTMENFKRYLGLAPDESIVLEQNITAEAAPTGTPNFAELAKNNYAVLKAVNDQKTADYTADVSRAAFLPSLDFSANYTDSGPTYFPEQNTWSLGLTLSIPLFDGWKDYASYRSNKSKVVSAAFSLQNILSATVRDLKTAYYNYVEAFEQEKVDTSFKNAAILRAEIARKKYKNGLLSFEDWDLIESDLILKEKNYILSEKDRIVKQSLWEKAQGIGVFK